MSQSPNAAIDAAIKKLMKDCEGELSPERESSIKTKVEVLKAAMTWEKLKHGIKDKNEEGSNWGAGAPDEERT